MNSTTTAVANLRLLYYIAYVFLSVSILVLGLALIFVCLLNCLRRHRRNMKRSSTAKVSAAASSSEVEEGAAAGRCSALSVEHLTDAPKKKKLPSKFYNQSCRPSTLSFDYTDNDDIEDETITFTNLLLAGKEIAENSLNVSTSVNSSAAAAGSLSMEPATSPTGAIDVDREIKKKTWLVPKLMVSNFL